MFSSKATGAPGDLNGFLDAGSHMQGELRFEDTFRIDGHFNGTITTDGDLVIGDGGEVEGNIRIRRLFVSGTVRGEVTATERIEITNTGRVLADISTPALTVEEGAFLEGRCSMKRDDRPASESEPSKVAKIPIAKKG